MSVRTILLMLLGAVALFAQGLYAEENPADAVELKIYDISELTNTKPDYPGPELMLMLATPPAPPINTVAYAPKVTVTPNAASIADMIKTRIRPDTWDQALGTSIEEMGGRLVVMQRPEIHALIADLLKILSSEIKVQVVVRGMLIPAATVPDETYFDLEGLRKTLGGNPVEEALATPQLSCYNKQRAHSMSGTELNYVADMDVNGDTWDPVIRTLFTGVVFDVRPTLSLDRKSTDLDLCVSMNANASLNPRMLGGSGTEALRTTGPLPQGATSSTTTKKENGKTTETTSSSSQSLNQLLNSQYAIGYEVDAPSVDSEAVRTHVTVPHAKWVLAGNMKNPDEKSPKKNLLVFVSAEIVK